MLDFRFLKKEEIDEMELEKKNSSKAAATDFALILGAEDSLNHYYKDIETLENRVGDYWSMTKGVDGNDSYYISDSNVIYPLEVNIRDVGARPVTSYSSIAGIGTEKTDETGEKIVTFGEYPQKVASKKLQNELNNELNKNTSKFKTTTRTYTVDSISVNNKKERFKPQVYIEYEYKGKKYVRVKVNKYNKDTEITLSNEEVYKDGDYVWIEVLPVNWIIKENIDRALSERILFAGIQFNNEKKYDGNFNNTDIKKYISKYFTKELTAYLNHNNLSKLRNPYEFDFKEVSEEGLIRASLESNITPFLHGKSSDGKSARIKQFDPDAEIVYLRNATPDSLNGKSVYDSKNNRMIDVPPTWYVKLKEKCDAEPDKLHIVFFDELTNALPSIQGMAFNIILDKEINGKWKLPENARVAAAGNDLEDSLAANIMAEPLFNRFNHVYINTSVNDWLSWALTPNNTYERLDYKKQDTTKQLKIHPAIYAFIACKKNSVLRTKYTGVKPNADPRKWEMASKVLYQTNNPYMLRGLIGEDLTHDFAAFCKTKVISIKDVINYNYDEKNFRINVAEKYLTVLSLSNVDEENLKVVREFIENLGKDFLALFDSLWTIGDDERLEKLMNLKQGKIKVKK